MDIISTVQVRTVHYIHARGDNQHNREQKRGKIKDQRETRQGKTKAELEQEQQDTSLWKDPDQLCVEVNRLKIF